MDGSKSNEELHFVAGASQNQSLAPSSQPNVTFVTCVTLLRQGLAFRLDASGRAVFRNMVLGDLSVESHARPIQHLRGFRLVPLRREKSGDQ